MKPSRVIFGTFMAMLVTQTIGSIDSKHRLPAPKQFVAMSVLWGVFFLLADTTLNKIAARLSVLIWLTSMVLGPFGNVAINFLRLIATNFAPTITNKLGVTPGDGTDATDATGTKVFIA